MNNTKKILIIDDDPVSIKVLVDHLIDMDYEVEAVMHGHDAWGLLINNPLSFDVIILDRMLEDIEGIELLRRIKSHPYLATIPVIMQTGEADSEEYISALKEGIFDFIYKPVEKKLLMYLVKNALQKDLIEKQKSFDQF